MLSAAGGCELSTTTRVKTAWKKFKVLKPVLSSRHLSFKTRGRVWKLSAIDPYDRDTWRSGVRSAMRAASQLPGRGPTVVDMAPIPAR